MRSVSSVPVLKVWSSLPLGPQTTVPTALRGPDDLRFPRRGVHTEGPSGVNPAPKGVVEPNVARYGEMS